jgi:hypothetical protein
LKTPAQIQQTMEMSLTVATKQLGDTLKKVSDGSAGVTKRSRSVLEAWEKQIGGREALIETLSLSVLDMKQQHFLRLLETEEYATKSLAQIIKLAGLTPHSVVDLHRVAIQAINSSLVAGQISNSLPDIVQDMAEKSVDAWVECPECKGTGEGGDDLEGEQLICLRCRGRKMVFRPSDLDRQKILLEAGGVTKRGGGMSINVQQNNLNSPSSANFSKSMRATDDLAYEAAEVIEADVKADDA